jgi:predicted nuclease of restriction endonuclease-like RecB superfamily
VDLRTYQEAALSAWELAQRRGVIALPTGSGKTRLALAVMQRTQLSALCLVPTRVLLDQWWREASAVYRDAIGCYGDGVRRLAPVTIATFEGAYRHMHEIGHRFDLLIVDEVHHFGGGFRDEALEMAIADARLGLTATPPRDTSAAACLSDLVGPTVFELTVGDLAGGFLASFDAITLYLDLSPEERSSYMNLSSIFKGVYTEFHRAAPGASWTDFGRHAARTPEGRRALVAWRQMRRVLSFTHAKRRALRFLLDRHRDSKMLVFTADNDTAYTIAREHLVMPLTCDIHRQERDDVLDRFRAGDLRTLVSARVLNEGLVFPTPTSPSSSGARLESESTCSGSAGCSGRARANVPSCTSSSHGTPSKSVRREGDAAGLLPDRPASYSVAGTLVIPHFLAEHDHPWLRSLLVEHERFIGRPQRELDARLRDPLPSESPPGKLRLAIEVLTRLGRGQRNAAVVPPRRARALVFGEAARTSRARPAVLSKVATSLGVSVAELRDSLFADLPAERLVSAPGDPLSATELALRGNLALVQRLLFHAAMLRVTVAGNTRLLVRHAKWRGLICTVAERSGDEGVSLEISGPFALFRNTRLYGRALGELVPLLAWCARFRLQADCVLDGRRVTLELATGDPICPARPPRPYDSRLEERFAREFRRLAPEWDLLREPEPIAAEGTLIFPDFALQHRAHPARRWLLEIVGFWTPDYVARKLASYRKARVPELILCLDEARNCAEADVPPGALVVKFRRRVDPLAVLRAIGAAK